LNVINVCLCDMCDFVEDTPESYDDVITSGQNSYIKKGVF